jgi:hypothetical protein
LGERETTPGEEGAKCDRNETAPRASPRVRVLLSSLTSPSELHLILRQGEPNALAIMVDRGGKLGDRSAVHQQPLQSPGCPGRPGLSWLSWSRIGPGLEPGCGTGSRTGTRMWDWNQDLGLDPGLIQVRVQNVNSSHQRNDLNCPERTVRGVHESPGKRRCCRVMVKTPLHHLSTFLHLQLLQSIHEIHSACLPGTRLGTGLERGQMWTSWRAPLALRSHTGC